MNRHEFVGRNLKAEMVRRGITPPEMALAMGISTATLYRRLRHPELFSVKNLDDAAQFLKLPLEVLLKRGA